ncbi:putative dehydrogenase [Actinoplanes campanulatus]|uniref:Putative dehydrogenase n=1 Tax=Actinoplanes campanulatus TaxID=113559 RepID=A0A7W5ANY8_9ACTN|nr:Gfo/Idh/MocA family oxidoreductase [Actinoplanes campanulatus]MBB3099532.1 putative dehydrogenase [Actinoplanes campanulatus]GGN42412.1 dehydrogenase [Actinoplanes campanulatus]GID39881.1 dehydrogenase [Actinoplanes campanulatus]
MPLSSRRRYALVGAGSRAGMFLRAITGDHADVAELVAMADTNQARPAAHNRRLAEPVPVYDAADFTEMLKRERVDVVLVATVDRYHDHYVAAALDAGCDAITEKPMTVDVAGCRRILDAQRRTGRDVRVTFNYRYNPLHEAVKRVISSGEIGEIGSVHFEWLLDVRHGADYFRRWHRDKANSGGLLVHKAGHHFDLVNWWLDDGPEQVFAAGRLFFYGEQGRRHGYARDYDRAHGAATADGDPFALRMADEPTMRELYLEAEGDDGYIRDRNVFAPGVTIEDDMAVLVRYTRGASMSYHLTAYAPWEGYRVMFNGSRGRLELEVVESDHVSPGAAAGVKGEPGAESAAEKGFKRLLVRPFWAPPREVVVDGLSRHGHGGADVRMLADLIRPGAPKDPLGRTAGAVDGARALLTGLAANESLAQGQAVRVQDLLDLEDNE